MKLGKLIPTLILTTTLILPTIKTGALTPSELLNLSNSDLEISLQLPDAPSDGNITTGTVGGGRRSPGNLCTNSNQPPLTFLMSHNVNHIEMPPNLNRHNSNLSLYWYLPETNAQKAEFLILGNNGKFLYFQEFNIPQNQKGLVRLDLPNDIAFQADNVYKWELALVCQEFDRSSDEYVWGAIEPLDPDQESQLNNEITNARNNPSQENASTPEEAIANVYIRHNLWHKALGVFLNNNNTTPNNTNNTSEPLTELLNYFGLEPQTNLIGIVDENGFREVQ